MAEISTITQDLKIFFHENWKGLTWFFLTAFVTILSMVAYRIVVKTKKKNNEKNFSNPMYSIGAAIVNMERAVLYSDDNNFKFFARYAIRLCLGLPKSYPPDEPGAEEILSELQKNGANEALCKQIIKIYSTEQLPDDENEWNKIIAELRRIVKDLINLNAA